MTPHNILIKQGKVYIFHKKIIFITRINEIMLLMYLLTANSLRMRGTMNDNDRSTLSVSNWSSVFLTLACIKLFQLFSKFLWEFILLH